MFKYFEECIPIFVICTPIEVEREGERSGNDNGELKEESNGEDLIDFSNDALYTVEEEVECL